MSARKTLTAGEEQSHMRSIVSNYIFVLGIVMAIGPLSIDMYLPSFAAIANELHASPGDVQLSLVSFFAGMAASQLIFGPLSDAFGRKGPLCFGLAVYVAASLLCATVSHVGELILWRFAQALFGCSGIVIARAVIRDVSTGERSVRLFGFMMLVLGLAPVLAPTAGSLLIKVASWRLIFVVMAALGAVAFLIVAAWLPETHVRADKSGSAATLTVSAYRKLLADPRFLWPTLTAAFTQGGFLLYLSGAPAVFISSFGWSPLSFSLLFASNALAVTLSAQLVAPMMRRFGVRRIVGVSGIALVVISLLLLLINMHGTGYAAATASLLFLSVGLRNFISIPTTVAAMEDYPDLAGSASSAVGTAQILFGTLASFILSLSFDGTARPLFLLTTAMAVASALSWRCFVRSAGTAL